MKSILRFRLDLPMYLKLALLSVVFIGFSSAKAGSYEDFFAAIPRDDAIVVTALLQRGFDPNSRDPKGQVGVIAAVQAQSWRVVDALLAHPQLEVNAQNAAGESALMLAALKGNLSACQRLVERGAAVQHPGWSPIHYAATGPNALIVEFLLGKGADAEAASPNGSTPLMMAAQYGAEESVNILLRRGADASRRNERGLRAADFARLAGRESLALRLTRP